MVTQPLQAHICCEPCQTSHPTIYDLNQHRSKCKLYRQFKRAAFEAAASEIHRLYVVEGHGLHDVADQLNLPGGFQSLWKWLKAKNWSRGISDSKKTPVSKAKYTATNMKNHGMPHNFCREHPSRRAWQAKLLNEEGIVNVFQRKEVKEKLRETMYEKYGVYSAAMLPRDGRSNFSSIHKYIITLLEWFLPETKLVIEKALIVNNVKSYYYDIHINNTNLLIEVNGDYWHANPMLYKSNDMILYGSATRIMAADIWQRDAAKLDFARNAGYDVYVVWESDLKSDTFKICQDVIDWIKAKDENCKNQIDKVHWPKSPVRYYRGRKQQFFCE